MFQIIAQINRTVRDRLTLPRTIPLAPFDRRPVPSEKNVTPEKFAPLHDAPQQAILKAQKHLESLLRPEGFWEGRVYDNVTITSEYVMFLTFLGLLTPAIVQHAKKTILDDQLPDGGWNIYHGGASDHSATVEAYFALKICGMKEGEAPLVRARKKILHNGGIESTRVFTKIHLALFGQYRWSDIPVIHPELMLLPPTAPIHFYEFSSWSRAVIIPLTIVFHKKPVHKLPEDQQLDEIHVPGQKKSRTQIRDLITRRKWDLEQIFEVAQRALSIYEKIPVKPFRQRALKMAEKWILEHQEKDGSWCGIYPAMANSILALHLLDYPLDHPVLRKGLTALRSYAEETGEVFRMQSTTSPIWDTAIAGYALCASGYRGDEKSLRTMARWLVKKQILDVYGDWRFKGKQARPGGWPFEHENSQYPDIDDTALALLSLLPVEHAGPTQRIAQAIDRGIEWLLCMQSSDGGWGAFDRDNNRHILNQIPFADLKSLLDPSSPDVTGHVIEALGAAGYPITFEPIQEAVTYLQQSQESNGSWFGRWGVNYVYGTGAVLSGLKIAGEGMRKGYIVKARDWLQGIQNSDGGWGESCDSYVQGTYVPLKNSTPSQTAWALLGLLACPGADKAAIDRGINFLLQRQRKDGGWDEREWTGTGFPRHFYLRYDYYRIYFPLLALGRYVRGWPVVRIV